MGNPNWRGKTLAEDLAEMEAADPALARLGRKVDDGGHFIATGEEVGEVRMARNRERRLAVMRARRRLWPTRQEPEDNSDG